MVAVGEEELPHLDVLWERGVKNGVPGMIMISGDEVRRREPNINPKVSGALWASTGGICDPFGVVVAAAENAVMNGVTLMLETAFEDFIMEGNRIVAGVEITAVSYLQSESPNNAFGHVSLQLEVGRR